MTTANHQKDCAQDEIEQLPEAARVYKPLSYEDADRILQNVLRACGLKEAHMKKDISNYP